MTRSKKIWFNFFGRCSVAAECSGLRPTIDASHSTANADDWLVDAHCAEMRGPGILGEG
ncbi:hypothetical protein K227x_27320 [Rubripirellula lacrimiformis]|uniref:Uncharacterized protein n=1 Tax=Rubripirellula lacrimiformis TaxID=1930273 RepID=A0A517NB36_9BACT|nr:hypothetical protein K227x_27320 [Rubripirellula lacrimiformis]